VKDLRIAGKPSGMVNAFWYLLDILLLAHKREPL
jgi:hypothetical protein